MKRGFFYILPKKYHNEKLHFSARFNSTLFGCQLFTNGLPFTRYKANQ